MIGCVLRDRLTPDTRLTRVPSADAIERLLTDRELFVRMSDAARQRAGTEFAST